MKPETRIDDYGKKHVERPNCLKIYQEFGALTEDLLIREVGAGDYSFRLNDMRISIKQNPNAATVVYSELTTKPDWDGHPPKIDHTNLDMEHHQNGSYILWARSKGFLPHEGDQQKQENDMAQSAVLENVLEMGKEDRARVDQLRQQQLTKAEEEAREARARLAEAESKLKVPTEPKTTSPLSDLQGMGNVLVSLVTAVKPAPDNSLSEYLKLQAEREKTERERDKVDRQAATDAAAVERKRADDMQAQMVTDMRDALKEAKQTTAAAPASEVEILRTMVEKQKLMREAFGAPETNGAEEPAGKKGLTEKIVEALPLINPIITGFFGLLSTGFTAWQNVRYNEALLAVNGSTAATALKPPTSPEPIEPGKPAPPSMSPEQKAEIELVQYYMRKLEELRKPLLSHIKKGKTGDDFAEFIIENADEERAAYDSIRQLGADAAGNFDITTAKQKILWLMQQHQGIWPTIAPIQVSFDQFLNDFFNYDEIVAREGAEGA